MPDQFDKLVRFQGLGHGGVDAYVRQLRYEIQIQIAAYHNDGKLIRRELAAKLQQKIK